MMLALASCDDRKASSGAKADASKSWDARYFTDQTMPDSLALLPPPPAAGTPAMARDDEARRAALNLRGSSRYQLAIADADRSADATNRAFQCSSGIDVTAKDTPVLSKLLAKLRLDVRAASYRAKLHYKRPRPWVANNAKVCAPSETLVRDDGSYPSARGAVGWAYALVLADLNPARREAIMNRGMELGQSRVVCDAEWQSDIDAGRTLGAAIVDRLRQVKQFQSDIAIARQEVAAELHAHRRLPVDCGFEARSLASK
jgi:acid phosphatase (class A)